MSSPFVPLALLGLVAAAGFGSLRWYSRRLARSDSLDPRRLRHGIYRGMAVFGGIGFLGLLLTGSIRLTDGLLASLGLPTDGPAGALAWLPTLVAVTLVTTVTYLGAFPVAREYREATMSATAAAVALLRWQLTFVVPVVGVLAVVPLVADGGAVGWALLVVGLVTLLYVTSPWFVRLSQEAWRPKDRAERLHRLCSRAGVDVNRQWLLSAADSERAYAIVRGPPGLRTLFVTDYLLDEFEEDTAAALLAASASRPRVLQQPLLLLGLGSLAAGALFVVAGGLGGPTGVAVLVAVLVGIAVVAAVSRRLSYRADDVATQRVGTDALQRALQRVREVQGSASAGQVKGLFRTTPTLDQRLARLGDE